RDSIIEVTKKESAEELIAAFALVRAPQAAEPMLDLSLNSKAPGLARRWLDGNVGCAIAGLIPTAGGRGRVAQAATDFLRELKKRGHDDFIVQRLAHASADAAAKVRQDVVDFRETVYLAFDDKTTPSWLKQALETDAGKRLKTPAWVRPAD